MNMQVIRYICWHVGVWLLILAVITLAVVILASRGVFVDEWRYGSIDLWGVVDRATIVMAYLLTTFAVHASIQGLREGGLLRRLLERQQIKVLTPETRDLRSKTDVLVMLYYKNKELADETIDLLQPEMIALLGSDQADVAEYIAHLQRRLPKLIVIEDVAPDRNSAEDAEIAATALIQRARIQAALRGINRERIVCDVTAATKPMTIGMYTAAQRAGIDAIYVNCEYDQSRKPIKGTQQVQYLRHHPPGS